MHSRRTARMHRVRLPARRAPVEPAHDLYLSRVRESIVVPDPWELQGERGGAVLGRRCLGGERGDEPAEQALDGVEDRDHVGHLESGESRVHDTQDHHGGDHQIGQGPDLAVVPGQVRQAGQFGHRPHRRGDQHRRRDGHDCGAFHIRHPESAQPAPQQLVTDDRADEITQTVRQRQPAHHVVGVIEQHGAQVRRDHLDTRDADDHRRRRPRVLARVEHPQLDQRHRVWDERERTPRQH